MRAGRGKPALRLCWLIPSLPPRGDWAPARGDLAFGGYFQRKRPRIPLVHNCLGGSDPGLSKSVDARAEGAKSFAQFELRLFVPQIAYGGRLCDAYKE